MSDPQAEFHNPEYIRINTARLKHLAALDLPIHGRTVLDIGAGIGDLAPFFVARGCNVTCIEPRAENYARLSERFPAIQCSVFDLPTIPVTAEIVFCYGVLYHVDNPWNALKALSHACTHMLLLETRISNQQQEGCDIFPEDQQNPSQSLNGYGCLPSHTWICKRLTSLFHYVYLPTIQPEHSDYPTTRQVYVASRDKLKNPLLHRIFGGNNDTRQE